MGKLADDFRSKWTHAHPDERLEISLLSLFSYDRFSTVPPEKGWILPLESYPDKPVCRTGTCMIVRCTRYRIPVPVPDGTWYQVPYRVPVPVYTGNGTLVLVPVRYLATQYLQYIRYRYRYDHTWRESFRSVYNYTVGSRWMDGARDTPNNQRAAFSSPNYASPRRPAGVEQGESAEPSDGVHASNGTAVDGRG